MAAKSAKTTFGSEVRKLRLLLGMSLRHLARRVGISPVYLSDIENNRKPAPSAEILQTVITALHADHDEFMRLAMKSVEEYGCVARKPRMSEQLSTDEYLLIVRKKQTLEPDEFKSWLNMTTVANTRSERKIKQRIRDIIVARLLKDQQQALDFDAVAANGFARNSTNGVRSSIAVNSGDQLLRMHNRKISSINHYEGQSGKEALEIYVDTCYREWRSIKSDFGRNQYFAGLEQSSYIICTIALSSAVLAQHD
jgi:transcriptional regulator with XRE-family HTH domain